MGRRKERPDPWPLLLTAAATVVSFVARYLLPLRQASSSSGNANASAAAPFPGTPGRWQLPEDVSQLEGVAVMMATADDMHATYVTYYFMQASTRRCGPGTV